jgi:murein DD-endopeptidase MepM/ murein hydrolase activator NlpD
LRRSLAGAGSALLLLVTIPAAGPRPAQALDCEEWDDICHQLKDAQAAQASTNAQLDRIQKQIKDTQQKMVALAALIRQLDGKITAQQAQIEKTQHEIDVLDRRVRQTQADIDARQAHIDVREQLLQQRVRTMDKHGAINYLQLAFSSTSFNQLVDRIVIMQGIIRSDRQLIEDLKTERAAVQRLKDDLSAQRRERAALLDRQQQEKAALHDSRAQQQAAYDYQKQLEAQFESQRQELERQAAVIKAQVAELQAQYDAEARAAGGGTGQFVWPEASHYITQGFGCSDLLGEPYAPQCPSRHFHMGLDIGGPYGAPIYAADAGVASNYCGGWGGGYGSYVIVVHGSGYSTLYAHMSSCAAQNGQVVRRGQVIGYEGSTGYSTGAHLHFEVRYNNAPQNPCAYLGC